MRALHARGDADESRRQARLAMLALQAQMEPRRLAELTLSADAMNGRAMFDEFRKLGAEQLGRIAGDGGLALLKITSGSFTASTSGKEIRMELGSGTLTIGDCEP